MQCHFYSAFSRIGLKNPPIHSTQPNIGVEDGPKFILTPQFLANLPNSVQDYFYFSAPEKVTKNFHQKLAKEIIDFKNLINQTITPNQIQIVIGGDHSVTFPSILAVIDRISDTSQIAYIQFDSHGDLNLSQFSPTQNWHGMYLRPLFGKDFDIPEINHLITRRIPIDNVIYIGNLDLDEEEAKFFKNHNFINLNQKDLLKHKSLETISKLLKRTQHLHISFDIDCLDSSIAPSTGIPAKNGLLLSDIEPIFKLFKSISQKSIDLVEYNPYLIGSKQTLPIIHKVLLELLN